MLADLPIGRTVVPRLGLVKGGEFQNDHALDLGPFEHFVTSVRGEHTDRVPGEGAANFREYVSNSAGSRVLSRMKTA